MNFTRLKGLVPHLVAVIIFVILSGVYFYPQIQGMQLQQSDIEQYIGMSKEISNFRDEFKKEPLWTNAAFSGMPAYPISVEHTNYVASVENFLIFKVFSPPIGYILLAMIAFYILLLCFDINPWISIIGSVAFGFSSIFVLYLGAGHNSKVHAIAILPAVIGSMLLAYRKNYKVGAILLSFFVCLELAANHVQMTYYGLFLIALIAIAELIIYIRNKQLLKYVKISSVLVLAALLGIIPSFSNLYSTYEYSKQSTRGKSDLTISPNSNGSHVQLQTAKNALDADYITQYSMGVGETWSLVIPDVKGGAETYLGNKKDIMKDVDPQYRNYVAQEPSYWGEQLFSGGAFYFGASIFILFILGLVFIQDPIKWAFLAASALGIVLSWKYGQILHFFIEHFPLFNKFRDTKMMLILAQISFPFIGMFFLKELFHIKIDRKKLLYVILIVNGLLVFFYLTPSTFFSFQSTSEASSFNQIIQSHANNPNYQDQFNQFVSELEKARIAIFKKDVARSLFFSLLVSGLVYFYVTGKVKKKYLLMGLGLVILIDLWMVDKRYLNNDRVGSHYKMWVDKHQYNNPYQPSTADNFILHNEISNNPALGSKIEQAVNHDLATLKHSDSPYQKDLLQFRELDFASDYRVLTLQDPFSNGEVSFFHKSIGGYNGAKLKKYQELIDFYLAPELATITAALKDTSVTSQKISRLLQSGIPVLNMLNTKYIIFNSDAPPIVNSSVDGYGWFVKDVKLVPDANEEMLSLGKVNLKTTAVINQKFNADIPAFKYDSTASLQLTLCLPNRLVYQTKANSPQLAVFSEIYYPKGWNAYIDGKKTSYFSADYLLRSLMIPAGAHTIEFRFNPSSYAIGETISKASSILLLLILLGFLVYGAQQWIKQ